MADKKISALTASTTPLAGTEVLPIVQGGATVKVSVANLTAGRAVAALSTSTTDGYQFRATDNTSYELLRVLDGTVNPGAFIKARAATKDVTLFASGSSVAGQRLMIGAESVEDVVRVSKDNVTVSYGNLVIGTAGKGITDSTGATSLQFTSLQVVSNKQIVAPSVVTATGNTASTPTATPVTLFTPSGDGVWIVNALVTLTGAPAAYITSSMIKASGGVLAATPISIATNISISVSGANVQATQTSGGNQIIAFSYIRLF